MNKKTFDQVILKHSLLWGWAFITPPVVMVVLDVFDEHTPSSVALVSTFMLMIPFVFCNRLISTALSQVLTGEEAE